MNKRQTKILLGIAAAVLIATVAVVSVVLATGGKKAVPTPVAVPPPTHTAYRRLYAAAVIGKTRISVLNQWPKPPYQRFHSSKYLCYEWYDKPVQLYSLCFRRGLLEVKEIG
jgi:hypothetical protein